MQPAQYIQAAGQSITGLVTCDLCQTESPCCFVNGKTILTERTKHIPPNEFINMCIPCFKEHGKGLGKGVGIKYCKKQ